MKKRIIGLDLVKGIAMFLVVMLHYSFYTMYYSDGIAGTLVTVLCVPCVPLFFMVNGALLLPREKRDGHYAKVIRMIVVMLIWKVLAALFFVSVGSDGQVVTLKSFVTYLLGGNLGSYPTGYFWFMNALIGIYLLFPLVKMAFDAEGSLALRCLVLVLFTFTVGKDTLKLVLQVVGMATGHDFASIVGSLGEFYLFGQYGYTLLYFIAGGLIKQIVFDQEGHADALRLRLARWKDRRGTLIVTAIVCYGCTFLVQRFQHISQGINLTVTDGYWLLPTFVGSIAGFLLLCPVNIKDGIAKKVVTTVGNNTYGVYMLHIFALVIFSWFQRTEAFYFMGGLPGYAATLVNVACALVLFSCCCAVSALLRRVPLVGRLFAL